VSSGLPGHGPPACGLLASRGVTCEAILTDDCNGCLTSGGRAATPPFLE
jgi:hypothetical protein